MLDKNNLAPIGVSTYKRLTHLQQCVAALKNNVLAPYSDVYFFSDAPQKGDEEAVNKVRDFLKTVSGFKSVTIFERTENSRVANNRGGMKELLDKYGKIIFLEEDVITHPDFLTYLNTGLEKYKDNKDVFSISAYCPPINTNSYEVYAVPRFNAWGFGIWKDRFIKGNYPIDINEYELKIKNRAFRKKIKKMQGDDVVGLYGREVYKEIDALDIRFMYYQINNDVYTIYPPISYTHNIGFDGSGLHCGVNTKYDVSLDRQNNHELPNFPDNFSLRKESIKRFIDFRRFSIKTRLGNFLRSIIRGRY